MTSGDSGTSALATPLDSDRISLIFSAIGHGYMHMFTAFFFTIVLALEDDWGMAYHDLIELWTPGAVIVGLAALPAGWLADRWSATGMMVLFFIGLGCASIVTGFARTPTELMLALALIGTFAAIYHPVGLTWVIRITKQRLGMRLAVNGIFGGIGVALAAAVAGSLTEEFGWKIAFILPGIVCIATGVVLLALIVLGKVREPGPKDQAENQAPSGADRKRAIVILLFALFVSGIMFQCLLMVTPKLFQLRLTNLIGDGNLGGVGFLVAFVFTLAGLAQLVGGKLADRFPAKLVYIWIWALMVPILAIVAVAGSIPLVLLVALAAALNTGSLPAESVMMAHYAPAKRHGLFFGLAYVVSFASAPISIETVSLIEERTGEFAWLFYLLAIAAFAVMAAALFLPNYRIRPHA